MTTIFNDIKYSIRQLAKSPGFTTVNVLTLAIAIGATTAIYSAFETSILDPLPIEDADHLMMVESLNIKDGQQAYLNTNAFGELRCHPDVFEQLSTFCYQESKYRGNEYIELISGVSVSPSFFSLFGVQPFMGRTFAPDEGVVDAEPVVILSYGFWKSKLDGDPNVIGQSIEFDEGSTQSPFRNYTIVGVMPDYFRFPSEENFWMPMPDPSFDSQPEFHSFFFRDFPAYFHLAQGVPLERAQAILDTITKRQADVQTGIENNADWTLTLHSLSKRFSWQAQWSFFVVIALVWLIVCANVANMLLARAENRRHELAMRGVLGASRGRLVRQMLTESLLLALLGGVCGLTVTHWSLSLSKHYLITTSVRPLELNWIVFFQAMGIALLTGVIFGVVPAWSSSKTKTYETLKQSSTTTTRHRGGRSLIGALVLGEIALAVVLLAGAGLMVRSVSNLLSVDVGYNPKNLLKIRMQPPLNKYDNASPSEYVAHLNRMNRSLNSVTGIRSVGFFASGAAYQQHKAENSDRTAFLGRIGCGVGRQNPFVPLGIPLIEGRTLDDSDMGTFNVVLTRKGAQALWPDESAIGKRISCTNNGEHRIFQVIGVVADYKRSYEGNPRGWMFLPYDTSRMLDATIQGTEFYVRTNVDPTLLTQSINTAISAVEPDVIGRDFVNIDRFLYEMTKDKRLFMAFMISVATIGLGLAAIGLYGLMAFGVQRRTREFGVRMALGASRNQILGLVMHHGLRLTLIGLVLGVAGSCVGSHFLQSKLYGVSISDPWTLASVVVVLFVTAFTACFLPAYRAGRVDPMTALKAE